MFKPISKSKARTEAIAKTAKSKAATRMAKAKTEAAATAQRQAEAKASAQMATAKSEAAATAQRQADAADLSVQIIDSADFWDDMLNDSADQAADFWEEMLDDSASDMPPKPSHENPYVAGTCGAWGK